MPHNTREGIEEAVDDYLAITKVHPSIDKRKQLIGAFHQELQKARDGFKERIDQFLNGMKAEINISNEYKLGYRQALLDLKEAYQSELDQPTEPTKELPKSIEEELQKARHDWLREEIVKLKDRQLGWLGQEEDGSDRHPNYDELQTIIDRYQSELDQPTV